jgi:hypothetical protein
MSGVRFINVKANRHREGSINARSPELPTVIARPMLWRRRIGVARGCGFGVCGCLAGCPHHQPLRTILW